MGHAAWIYLVKQATCPLNSMYTTLNTIRHEQSVRLTHFLKEV